MAVQHSWRVPAEAAQVRGVRREVQRLAAGNGLSAEQLADVLLAVSEVVTNAVRHGFPEGGEGTVELHVEVRADSVLVRVVDDGIGCTALSADPGAGLGRGMVRSLADSVSERATPGGGHTVQMAFCDRAHALTA